MTGWKTWDEIRDRHFATPEAKARLEEARREVEAQVEDHARTLRELRRARLLTQEQLARSLSVSQAQVSRIESQTDLYLSTLRSYVQAIGGDLELYAAFPDGQMVEISIDELLGKEPEEEAVVVVEVVGVANGVFEIREHPKGWALARPGRTRATAVLPTKEDAISRAKALLERRGGGEATVRAAAAG